MTLPTAGGKLDAIVGRFSRITTSGKILPEIDGLRFIAISAVVLVHSFEQIAAKNGCSIDAQTYGGIDRVVVWFCTQGFYGVHLFFIISGFILGLQFAEKNRNALPPPPIKAFYLRRITRLEPPYILSMLLFYVLAATLYTHGLLKLGGGFRDLFPQLLACIAYVSNAVYHRLSYINPVAWSLEVEVQFYLLMPCVAFLLYKIRGQWFRSGVLVAAILAAGILNDLSDHQSWIHKYTLAGFAGYFLVGVLLSERYTWSAAVPGGRLRWDTLGCLAAIVFLASRALSGSEWHYPICLGLISWAGLRGSLLPRFLRLPLVWIIGGMCYSIYLYHYWVLALLARALAFAFSHGLPLWLNLLYLVPVLAVVALSVAAVMYLFVERPCMDKSWPQKLWVSMRR
jgi:peptidoglycan/LPS O-acetylase OafA/YrhL